MNEQDKITITKCLPELVRNIQLSERFTKLLVEKRVFSQAMISDIMASENRQGKFFGDLQRRGPASYKQFVAALLETGQTQVVRILEEKRAQLGYPPHELSPCQSQAPSQNAIPVLPVGENMPPNASSEYRRKVLCPPTYLEEMPSSPVEAVTDALAVSNFETLDIVVTPSEEMQGLDKEVYPNNLQCPRGLALILNYKHIKNMDTREGSERDVIHLDKLLQALGYKVIVRSDLTAEQTRDELNYFVKDEAHQEADSTVVAIMSHGKDGSLVDGTLIYTSDGRCIASEEVLRRFNGVGCSKLKGKPKIFLFQFCRGDQRDEGIRSTVRPVTHDGKSMMLSAPVEVDRSFDDMLIAYSTIPGHVSYREEDHGTWFIKAICLVFMKHACVMHVHNLLTMVDQCIRSLTASTNGKYAKQTTEIAQRGFNKKFYFNPGLWAKAQSLQNP